MRARGGGGSAGLERSKCPHATEDADGGGDVMERDAGSGDPGGDGCICGADATDGCRCDDAAAMHVAAAEIDADAGCDDAADVDAACCCCATL